jgi:hypothetical protein
MKWRKWRKSASTTATVGTKHPERASRSKSDWTSTDTKKDPAETVPKSQEQLGSLSSITRFGPRFSPAEQERLAVTFG